MRADAMLAEKTGPWWLVSLKQAATELDVAPSSSSDSGLQRCALRDAALLRCVGWLGDINFEH